MMAEEWWEQSARRPGTIEPSTVSDDARNQDKNGSGSSSSGTATAIGLDRCGSPPALNRYQIATRCRQADAHVGFLGVHAIAFSSLCAHFLQLFLVGFALGGGV